MRFLASTRIVFLALLLASIRISAVDQPGVVPKDPDCSSCHTKKVRGRSVHSVMSISCMVCHVAKTQGDMTTLNLAMPREQICFACHEKSAALQQHVPVVKGSCVDCHDAHSSDQRMLLLANLPAVPSQKQK